MQMQLFIFVFIAFVTVHSFDLSIRSDEDCFSNGIRKLNDQYAVRINFAPTKDYHLDQCVIDIDNAWSKEMQNGFGVFLIQPIDCSTTLNIECSPGTAGFNRTVPMPIQYTCHTSLNNHEIPCQAIRLTFQRHSNNEQTKSLARLQVTALAKAPCLDRDLLYACRESYPDACIDGKLRCNGRSECPRGDDERSCHQSSSEGVPLIVIILLILAFLFLICVLTTVLICCCCRAACHSILRRFRNTNRKESTEKGITAMAHGEDAGLIKGLTTALPQQHLEPTAVVIDSTKPVYPRLE